MFKALVIDQHDGATSAAVRSLEDAQLPPGDVTIAVEYSTVNYKDGLVASGASGLVKRYPHVPGVDFAGNVLESRHAAWRAGDAVILTGWRVGELQWGGLAQRARVNGDWLVRLPNGMTSRHAMAIGTAGLTAMLALLALESHGLAPQSGEVLVTGAAGGVGSIATALLAQRGYRVVASTGRTETHDYLRGLGAAEIIDRTSLAEASTRPLEAERWAACIDAVGGNTLARVLAQTRYGGSVAAVGLAGGSKLEHTVIPFLLRGINLLGIDSVMCSVERRIVAWNRLQAELPINQLEAMMSMTKLDDVPAVAADILQGKVRGRIVVDVNA
jgi:acrylyl-CoA reductase (NADPH)